MKLVEEIFGEIREYVSGRNGWKACGGVRDSRLDRIEHNLALENPGWYGKRCKTEAFLLWMNGCETDSVPDAEDLKRYLERRYSIRLPNGLNKTISSFAEATAEAILVNR